MEGGLVLRPVPAGQGGASPPPGAFPPSGPLITARIESPPISPRRAGRRPAGSRRGGWSR